MAIITKPAGSPVAPNELTEKVAGAAAIPNNPTEKAVVDPSVPNNLTEKAATTPAIPIELTEKAAVAPSIPNAITEKVAGVPSIPIQLTEQAVGVPVVPINLTEKAVGVAAVPNNPTEKAAGVPSIPNELTEAGVAGFPRALSPLVGMDFANQLYIQDDRPVLFEDLFTYARNSNASFWNRRLNRNGKWETFLDTDIVGSVENLVTYSEQFDHSDWGTIRASTSSNTELAPDGTRTADKLIEDSTSSATHYIRRVLHSFISGTTYTFSIRVKKSLGGRRLWISFADTSAFAAAANAYFNIDAGTIGTIGADCEGASIVYEGDDWYKCSITATADATATSDIALRLADSISTTYTGDGVSGLYLWGAQLTESAKPLPYVKTISVAVTETFTESLRIEYDPITAETKGALIEGGVTNLALRSEEFDNAVWAKNTATVTTNDEVAPDGTTSMDLITPSTTSGRVQQVIALSTSTEYNVSAYLKNGDSTQSNIRLLDVTGADIQAQVAFNWTGEIPSTASSIGATNIVYTNVGNGVYRISFTGTTDAVNTSHRIEIYPDTLLGTGNVYVWGAQLEALPFASSYIRTEGAAVARAVDDASLSSAGNFYSQKFTLSSKFDFLGHEASNTIFAISNDSTSDRVMTTIDVAGTITFAFKKGGAATGSTTSTSTFSANTEISTHNVFNGSQAELYVNGVLEATDATAESSNSVSIIDIGARNASGFPLFGHLKRLNIYEEAMTAQEVSLR